MAKNKDYFIGVDLGGTKVLAALVSAKGKVKAEAKSRTPAEGGPAVVIGTVVDTVEQLVKNAGISLSEVGGIGIGTPGVVDTATGYARYAPNLAFWDEVPLGPQLESKLKRPVVVGNDVDVSTYGEYSLGAGSGCQSAVGIFPGTGIGGALILNGQLHTGARGSAAEIGHMVIEAQGPLCGCGRRGCAEAVASRTAIERDLRTAIQFGRKTVLTGMVQEGDRIRSGTLAEAAAKGDALVLEVLYRTAHYLGLLAGSIINFIDPEMVIFGGGLIEACADYLMPTIRGTTQVTLINRLDTEKVRIEVATLGDHAGVLGAAMLARSRFD